MEELSLQIVLLLLLFGFLAAFIDSVVGGGGLISTPALLFLGLPPAAALATNKLAGTMGVLTSTIRFVKSGKVDFRVVGKWFPFVFIQSSKKTGAPRPRISRCLLRNLFSLLHLFLLLAFTMVF